MLRRVIDILAAGVLLLLLSPLLIIVFLTVTIDSAGSPIYFARRVGKNGRVFRMWKFRTMVSGAAKLGPAVTGKSDPRITRLGRILRRTKLDELPQFINVLLGDMTLVGPRPEAPEMVAHYTPPQRQVLLVKPGVTGWSQLLAGNEEDRIPGAVSVSEYYITYLLPEKLERDLRYQETRTAASDTKIVFATVGYCLRSLFFRGE